MKVNGFKAFAAILAVVFGFSNANLMGQSYQYLISDAQEADTTPAPAPTPVAQDSATIAPIVEAEMADDAGGDASNQIQFGGWIQAGYHTYDTGMFNNRNNKLNLHQAYLYAEKAANADDGLFGLGFRADYVYGIDGPDTQAFGGPAGSWDNQWDSGATFGQAIPQLYAEMAMGDASFKVGHFYTIMGYEVVTAPDNFFYSHAYTMFNSEPFTHTGVLGTFDFGDLTLYGGWTLGWDSGFDTGIDDGSNFLGGASFSLGDFGSLTHTLTFGRLGAGSTTSGYAQSFVGDFNVTENLNYIFQSDFVDNPGVNESFGVNNYLLYSLSDTVGVGTRVEWWRDDLAQADLFGVTAGFNVKVGDNMIIRPEIRYDRDNDGRLIPADKNQILGFGMDAILTF